MNGVVIIRLTHTMQDRTPSGIFKDITFDRHGKMMISAEVVAVSERGSNDIVWEIKEGAPRSKEKEPVYRYNRDVKHNIRVGDIVYFHYLTLENPHNYITYEAPYKYYKVSVNRVFCSMRPQIDGGYWFEGIEYAAYMHNDYVFGIEYFGSGWEEVEIDGKKIGAKIKQIGDLELITETKSHPLLNRATITNIGHGIDPYSRFKEVKPGDNVVLKKDCEFINNIANQERWVFTHSDILGVLESGTIRPVCDWLLLELKPREYHGKLEVDKTKLKLQDEGYVISCGKQVDQDLFVKGTEVKYERHKSDPVLNDTHVLVQECNIFGIMKYSL